MHKILIVAAASFAIAGCSKEKAAEPAPDANVAAADANAAMTATPAAFTINETSWEYTDIKTKKPVQLSVDGSGNYVVWSGAEHVDHGTAVSKDGKACFTSAMNKDGEKCWTDAKLEVGASGETVSDKGDKLALKRIAYVVAPPMK
ncbi:MAG: hypothetical protein ABIT69_07705 [Sphingomicrobium sp.]